MAEKVKTEGSFAEPGDVECDFCTGRKRKATESCLLCLASYCKTHVKSHYQSPAFKRHKLVEASTRLQEKLCAKHDKLMEIYCHTDQSCICYLCMMDEHKTHNTADAAAARTEKQSHLKKVQRKSQQRLQEKEKKLQKLKQAVNTLSHSAQSAVEDSERIFTELIRFIEKKRSEVTELIRTQEKTELSAAEERVEQLEQEITDLKRRHTELEQLSHTEDHIHFLQSFQSVSVSSGWEDCSNITVQHLSFDEVRNSLSNLKKQFEEFCEKEFCKVKLPELPKCQDDPKVAVPVAVQKSLPSEPKTREKFAAVQKSLPSEPRTREDFLQYFCPLTLDLNTVNHKLTVSEGNKMVAWRGGAHHCPEHLERFKHWPQVLSKESMSGRCYWEVEWDSGGWGVSISVSYKGISRKGDADECAFGGNSESWSLECSSILSFWHNNIETKMSAPPSSRIGVYVDHSAGTLSFYSVSKTMTLLHTVHTTFTQPLYAGFWLKRGKLKLCDANKSD